MNKQDRPPDKELPAAETVFGIPGLTKENAAARILADPRARAVYERLANK